MSILERGTHNATPETSSVPGPEETDMPAISTALPIPPMTMAKAMAMSVAVCTFVITVGIALAVWVTRGELLQGLGLGLFCALWGGPGFGLMGGGAVHALSQERAARLAAAHASSDADPSPAAR